MTKKSSHCPFYGVDEDICDVGCGYISPSDVSRIVTLCFGCHTSCGKYGELLERNNISRLAHPKPAVPLTERASAPRHHTISGLTRHGMMSFGGVAFTLGLLLLDSSMQYWPWLFIPALVSASVLILQGFRARSGNLKLVAVLQIPAGVFFLSLLSFLAFPAFKLITVPSSTSMTVYCVLWIIFAILTHSHLQRACISACGLPPTIILCALATLFYFIKPTAATTVAASLGLVVVGCIYLATALADGVMALRPTRPSLVHNRT